MKDRFSTIDVFAIIHDLKKLEGLRVQNIYDIDNKTYLLRLQKSGEKCSILIESGKRIHKTIFDWPKPIFPSSFSMKLRKHIRQKRLASIQQLGIDRIVDLQFGFQEHSCHVIAELYDRGNIILTDSTYTILNILRPRKDKDSDVRFVVGERYSIDEVRREACLPSKEEISSLFSRMKPNETLKRALAPLTQYGPPLIEHVLLTVAGINGNSKIKEIANTEENINLVSRALRSADEIFQSLKLYKSHGYIYSIMSSRSDGLQVQSFQEFHPVKFSHYNLELSEFQSFSDCVDEFFTKLQEHKVDERALNAERDAVKKMDKVMRDQEVLSCIQSNLISIKERIRSLSLMQSEREEMANLIELNIDLVDKALYVVRSAIASRMSWEDINEMRVMAAAAGDEVASSIYELKLDYNRIILILKDPFDENLQPQKVSIDLSLSAYQNAKNLHQNKKAAAEKQKRTEKASERTLKTVKFDTKETIDIVRLKAVSTKLRRSFWFEKFYWFISSENYLVVCGRDAQQNEILVKKYLRKGDVFVHADVRGGSTVVIRNHVATDQIPPKTLNESGVMAVCYSSAWSSNIAVRAWWVYHHQVSRTAPSGEYLTPGSFMIRGKKNFLPLAQLLMGFGLMFKLADESISSHSNERECKEFQSEQIFDVAPEISIQEPPKIDCGYVEEKSSTFPDVELKISGVMQSFIDAEEYTLIQIGPTEPTYRVSKTTDVERLVASDQRTKEVVMKEKGAKPLTLRQKHKAKQQKKYEHQDDEERELRVRLLAANMVGKKDESKKKLASKKRKLKNLEVMESPASVSAQDSSVLKVETNAINIPFSADLPPKMNEDIIDDENHCEETEVIALEEERKLIDSLTWIPKLDDVLLYAIPVVAPYQMMNNFKYKVKLTPGTGKRGKAAKSALHLFERDRTATTAERAFIKILSSDDQTSRNIPGKVRILAPLLHKN